MKYTAIDVANLALMLLREGSLGDHDNRLAKGWTVLNRIAAKMGPDLTDPSSIVLKKVWYSGMTAISADLTNYLEPHNETSIDCWAIATALCGLNPPADPTEGSIFYFDPPVKEPPAEWGKVTFAIKIGDTEFWKAA